MKHPKFASILLALAVFLAFFGIFNMAHAADDFIIAVDDNSRLYYAKSNGDGTFSDYGFLDYLGGSYSRGVIINDFNNDGHMDFVAGRGISSTAYFYLFINDGSNNFTKTAMVGTLSNANSHVMDMASCDFNNDGSMDFIANGNYWNTGLYLGDGVGNFTKTEMNLGSYGRGMDTADFDHDGNMDFIRARYSSGYINVYWGDGTGAFPSNLQVGDAGSDPYGLVAGDFNNDGHDDIIANSGSGGDPYLWTGNGDRTFTYVGKVDSLDFNNHGAYDGYDFNGDSNLDVVAVNYSGKKVLYYPGNGDGTFGTSVEIGTTSYYSLGISAMPIGPPAGVPEADISPTSGTIAEGGSVDFDGSGSTDSDGTITAWDWTFGDGGTDNVENPAAYTYAAEGIYYPNLKVSDNDGKSDCDAAVVIVEGDAPTVDTTPVSFGEALADDGLWDLTLDGANYASDTEGIVSYEWDIDDGYSDNFEDGNADGWDVFAGAWEIYLTDPIAGTYSYRQTDTGATRTWNLFDKVYDTDLTIEADVRLLTSYEEAHILFMAKNEQNNYEYVLRGRGNNDILLYRRINGSASERVHYDLPSDHPSYPIDDTGGIYRIKILCTGSLIEFYLDGHFLFSHSDSTFSSGKVGFSTYRTEALFDNLTVTTPAAGQTAQHAFEAGTYNVELTVTDAAGQTATGIIPMTMQPGAAPSADAGGPYSADESAVSEGGWTFSLDGSGSSDDVEIRKYVWDLGTDTFNGTEFQDGKWFTNGGITQDDAVSLTGANTWNTRYLVTKGAAFPKVKGQVFQTKIKTSGSGQCMFGFKNTSDTNFHYNQFPYEFYLYNGNIRIYESSNYRGDTGCDISYNTWYDFRIELKETGAVYSYRPSGTTVWYEVYNSNYITGDTSLRKGMVVYSGTYTMDDFVETTAGVSPDFTLYRGIGTFGVDLTVYDRAGQTDTDSTTVVITDGNDPVANAGPDQAKGEADASGGAWTVNFDATGSTDDHGIYTYEWDWDYDGIFDPSGDSGETISHSWDTPGVYTVAVRVTDHALQSHIDTMTVTIALGDPPTADAGGPYTVNEADASGGGWTAALDGSGSSDPETGIDKYVWDLGTDNFSGTVLNDGKWVYNGNVTQNDGISITTSSSGWGKDYLFSKDIYTRAKGMAFGASLKHSGGYGPMIGFKNTNTTYHYNQMPYAIYFYNSNIYIYEYGSNRGYTGYSYSFNTWYDVRIELKETQGAKYYYRESGTPDWILIYDSNYGSDTSFKRGVDVYSGTLTIDDIKEIAAGVNPSYRFYGLGSHTIRLAVWDHAGQTDTDLSSVTTQANDPPVADAGDDKSGDEADAFEGTWTFDFDGSGSTDDYGIYTYEWDWDNDGTYDETGVTATHTFDSSGSHTVVLRVTDHALQSDTDTATVTLTTGDPPTAEAGNDITTEGHWPVVFNGGDSSDDLGIIKYEWDFGDYVDYVNDDGPTSKGTGKTPTHIYWEPGDYTVTLAVYDNAMQFHSDTMTVHVVTGDLPVADAGGPYNAGAGGPPAYLNGSSSTDDYGIVKYLWDVDVLTDSDGDGTPDNDIDVVGRKPFYTYLTAGSYTAKLTVVDGAGQEATATANVNVATNLAPDVICVPWRAGDPTIPHETYNGRSIRLKAIVRDAGDLTYQWNFGDGSALYPATPGAVTNKYAVEASHTYPDSPDNTPYTATLTVWDSGGLVGTDNYYVIVKPDDLDTRTNIAIDEGLWWIHKNQDRSGGDYGKWSSYGSYYASPTGSAIQAFEINGHLQEGDNQEDPYAETVNRGFEYLFTQVQSQGISVEPAGDPDSNGNGIGIESKSGREIYEGGMIMDAIASSNRPLGFATTGGSNIKGRFYFHILTDMVDMYAWGQDDSGGDRGGWRYNWDGGADNSACQWAAIGMLAAEDTFGINIPQFVKEQDNDWLNYSYNGTGFGYTGPGNGVAQTPSGMVQLAFCDKRTNDPRWRTAEDYIANNWYWQHNNYYAAYALVKAMKLAQPNPVVTLSATGLDWYNDPTTGVRKRITDQQAVSGSYWGSWDSGGHGGRGLDSAWAVIMLTPTLFVQPPVADAGDDIIWAYDMELAFDAAGSFHMDPTRSIVKYEWDFDGNGTWDFTTTDPSDPNAKYTYPDPDSLNPGDPPTVYTTRLRVTDDNEPVQTDIDTREVTVAEPPHAPFAVHGGPYNVTAGIPFTLDGSGSYDIDVGDSIILYQWDLDNDGVWFDNVDVETTSATASNTFAAQGTYNIGLMVWDNGAFNPVGCTPGVNCTSMESVPVFTTVIVQANLAPTADADGPYTVDEGTPLTLNGSGSSDPNGDALSFAWDLDNDGAYDDSTDEQPAYTWMDDGIYTVGLKVSDSLLEDTDSTTVTVNDLSPTAAFTWAPEPQGEGTAVIFTDASTSNPDTITGWNWDFGGFGTSSDQNPSFTFDDNGTYTVTLTVTDEDGSTDTVSHDVTITDKAPAANVTGDTPIDEGQTGNYDATGSTSSPDAIVGYEWDWNYNGNTFNPSGDTGATQSHAWVVDGIYTVAVRVTDDDGSTDIATMEVTVIDAGVLTAVLTGDTALDEGQTGNYDASGSGGPNPITGYEWDWNYDGTTFTSSDTGATQSHIWMDNGTYIVAVRVTDDHSNTDIATLTVTVSNVAPNVDAGPDQTVNEGDTVNFSGSFTDSGAADTHTYEWNFGDGTPAVSGTLTPTHVYSSAGDYTVTLSVTDDDAGTGSDTLIVTVESTGPVCGDLDGDGDVDATDRSIFLSSYRKCTGDPGFIPEADYDGDGCITLNDYREWYRCYKIYITP